MTYRYWLFKVLSILSVVIAIYHFVGIFYPINSSPPWRHLRWSCLGGHFFCQISKQILFKTEDGETHPLAVNRSVLGGARKVI